MNGNGAEYSWPHVVTGTVDLGFFLRPHAVILQRRKIINLGYIDR